MLHIFLVALLGVVSCSDDSGSVLEVTVRPGDNVTLYCDCDSKVSSRVYIVWYRNCSHENQPSLVLKVNYYSPELTDDPSKILPRFQFVKNISSGSYDLLIENITDSDEGLYYCGTEETRSPTYVYEYGSVTTRILFNSSVSHHETLRDSGACWILLYSLCPALAVLSSLVSSLLVYHLCMKNAKETQADQQRPQTRLHQDEDVCYAALEIQQASQRPQKKKSRTSDFSTYSAINTSRM